MQRIVASIAFLLALVGAAAIAGLVLIFVLGERSPVQIAVRKPEPAGHSHDHGHSHGADEDEHTHDDDAPAVATTLWTEHVEYFYEHAPPVAGEPVELAIHATALATGEPIKQGSLTIRATGPAGADFEVRSETPTRPGIFLLSATFPKAGSYSPTIELISSQTADGADTTEAPAIQVFASQEESAKQSHDETSESGEDVSFIKEQQWRLGMLTQTVSSANMAESLTVPGIVTAPHPSEALVPPPLAGRVAPPPGGKFPHAGDRVEKGEPIAVIEPSIAGAEAVQLLVNQSQLHTLDAELAAKQLEAELQLAAAELDRQLAMSTYERMKELSEKGVTAGKNFLQATNDLQQAETRISSLEQLKQNYVQTRSKLASFFENIRADNSGGAESTPLGVVLRSPISGVVVEADVTEGEFVDAQHPLFRIINPERLFIEARISEYDLADVEKSTDAAYRLSAYPDQITPILGDGGGRLVFIGTVVDPDSRTVPIRYEVPNPDGRLRVGMFAEVLIETQRREQALAVPIDAVVDVGGESTLFVQTAGETFQARPVKLGLRSGDLVAVDSGLSPGERVVTRGGFAIRLSTMSGAAPQHHHH